MADENLEMFSTAVQAVLFLSFAITATLAGADLQGQVLIKRQLTKRTITVPVSTYDRGTAVELASRPVGDPLAFERTHVVVYIEGDLPSKPANATLEQKGRQFAKDLLRVPVGSIVSFPNGDPIFHNVFSLSKPTSFDLGVYPKGQTRSVTMTAPGIVYVNCHLHPNMSATVVVTPTNWSTQPDEQGAFSFTDLPPGKYTVVAWHKSAGFFRQSVHVGADTTAKMVFVIPFNEDGSIPGDRRVR